MSGEFGIEESSGNIFADLGFENPDMELNRALLALRIAEVVKERKLTQAAAAEIMGIDQPKVSAIMRGRLTGFSLERLMEYLARLGDVVRIVVEPKSADQKAGRIEVQVQSEPLAQQKRERGAVAAR